MYKQLRKQHLPQYYWDNLFSSQGTIYNQAVTYNYANDDGNLLNNRYQILKL